MSTAEKKAFDPNIVSRHDIVSGIITGQIAGLIMAVVVIVVFMLFLDKSFYFPVQVIGSIVFGEPALHGFHFGALLAGLVLHQAGPSLLWGVLYGLVAKKTSLNSTPQALGLALVLFPVSMTGPYILIPTLMNAIQGVDYWNQEVPMFWDWAAHLVFSLCFVLFPSIKSKLQTQR